MIIIIKIIKIIILFLWLFWPFAEFRNWKSRFFNDCLNWLELLLIDIVLIIALNQVRNVRDSRFYIFWHDSYSLQMIKLGKLEKFRFFFIAILLMNKVQIWRIFFLNCTLILLFFLCWLYKSHLGSNGKVSNRTMNDSFIELIFENVLLNGKTLLEIINGKFVHVHDCTNVELINPMNNLINS